MNLNLVIKFCIWPWGSKSQSQSHHHVVEGARTDRTKLKIWQTDPRNLLYDSFRLKLKLSVLTWCKSPIASRMHSISKDRSIKLNKRLNYTCYMPCDIKFPSCAHKNQQYCVTSWSRNFLHSCSVSLNILSGHSSSKFVIILELFQSYLYIHDSYFILFYFHLYSSLWSTDWDKFFDRFQQYLFHNQIVVVSAATI